ncbi:hypothetical protein GOD64_12880 [Sinorhizobium medicae]|uniref:hypothetical protein n=1 Tax=Rhizobium meliloti TaxID=382 RepID=UPI001296ACA1|nr:hypothetical protein [Sinorhizobium meliloti]MDW9473625.1 hypothetical protein [Sinorhizobium meliloti]MDX0719726.1 hypothetical protein [Sinorhizobium medicae]MQV23334.1 hypothetical protein [Sinorhizobium meliloti]
MKFVIPSLAAFFVAATANAADFQVCDSIAGKAGSLVDKSDSAQWQQFVASDFDRVCSDSERYESSLAGSSDATQASFGYAGYSLGYGQSSSDANSRSSAAIDKVCKTGKHLVNSYFQSVNKTVSGQFAANLVADCLRIMGQADVEALTGTTEVSTSSDTVFYVRIDFKPSSNAPQRTYKILSIQKDPSAEIECTESEGKNIQGMVITPQSQTTFTCTRKTNTDVNGFLNFAADNEQNASRTLRFAVPSKAGRELIREEIKQQITDEIDYKIAALRPLLLPKGSVVAVDNPGGCEKLGTGWADARLGGRFIIGADDTFTFTSTGGAATYALRGENMPELNLNWRLGLLGNDRAFRAIEGLTFGPSSGPQPNNPPGAAGTKTPQPIPTLPPYVSLYFCKKV